ncbi:ribonuclease [Candidatus Scalindua japonica]|uniref:Ribonuclease P protein component n=1 Tax=Candidatus Scalindua japonica TaxID=1284222 RepID=A0A286TY25_9BACT|nr:ribonuclease [Candidatus Scalindua japonica]
MKRKEFQHVFDNGERYGNDQLKIYALSNGGSVSRLGLVVGRKFGNAPRRNRFKRILREAYRLNKSLLSSGADIVVIPRQGLKELTLMTIEEKFKIILTQINNKLKK